MSIELLKRLTAWQPATNAPVMSKLPTMTPDELRAIRAEMGGTQADAAERFGVAVLTYKRWELGVQAVPGPAVLLSQLLLAQHRGELRRVRR